MLLKDPVPVLPQDISRFGKGFCRLVLKLMGWKFDRTEPPTPRFIVLMGPHTSNWDFVVGMFVLNARGVRYRFLIKKEAFVPGIGWFIRRMGGLPVDRARGKDAAADAVRWMNAQERGFVLVITPEGTRSGKTKLKKGFHSLAKETDAHIGVTSLDYERKEFVMGPIFHHSASADEIVEQMDAFMGSKPGLRGTWMDRPLAPRSDLRPGETQHPVEG